jgi:hypothetical protein
VEQHILSIASQGREAAAAKAPPGVDVAAIGRVVANAFTAGFHSGLWISGILLLVGSPVAFLTIRHEAHHVTHEERTGADLDAAREAGPAARETGPAADLSLAAPRDE